MNIVVQIKDEVVEVFMGVPTISEEKVVCTDNNEVLRAVHQKLMTYWKVNEKVDKG